MASSRKDTKGYVLRTGECQRSDGRYSYSYTDKESNRHVVYAKSLAELRKKEKKIIRDLEDGIDAHAPEKTTVNQLYDKYISEKYDLKPNTLDNVHTQLHPAFQMAVRDDLIRVNPTDGVMAEIKKSHLWEKPQCHALTIPQQKAFVDFITTHKEYCGWFPVLLPHFSAHNLRHTFCTRFCENESNLKVIQSVMGHKDISTTMDIYAEATEEKKQEIMASLQGKIFT